MRLVIQRVSEASVTVDGEVASSIGAGLLVLCGIHNDDDGEELGDKRLAEKVTKETIDWAARKVCNTRLWEDKSGKMWTQSAAQGGHEILLVSNFTLWAKLKGNKPDLHDAMGPDRARAFWERFVKVVQGMHKGKVQQGQFGADMKVRLCNDGPLTITVDSPEVALPAAKAKPAEAKPAEADPAAAKPAPKAEAQPAPKAEVVTADEVVQMAAKLELAEPEAAVTDSPVRCGELMCQRDSYARALTTTVLSCAPRPAEPPAPKGKKAGAAQSEEAPLWDVVLADTVLFPEGGGQPSDVGTVGGAECLRVENLGGAATHVLTSPLAPGSKVEARVDWARRSDHMAQHSAQHLVTALALRRWGFETTSWGLGEQTSYLELGCADFSPEQMAELELDANEAIRASHAVTPSWHSVSAVNDGTVPGLRKSSKSLPPSVTGPVRVVSFDTIDTNTCCGTHVTNTAQLQAIKLLRVEKAKRACRIHYVAGVRVLRLLGSTHATTSVLATRLASSPEQLVERYDELTRKSAETERSVKSLSAEVVALTATTLRARVAVGERVMHLHRAAADADFLKALATALDADLAASAGGGVQGGGLLLVTVGEGVGEGTFFLTGHPALVEAASKGVAATLEGRGGGRSGRFQGKCAKLGRAAEALEAARAAVISAIAHCAVVPPAPELN